MRSITTCPACQTQFFVTDTILNHSLGKVRCGNCSHVFIASEHIVIPSTPDIAEVTTNFFVIPLESGIEDKHANPPFINDKTANIGDYIPGRYQSTWLSRQASKPKTPTNATTWLMRIICALLVLTALGQGVYTFRVNIASKYPATREALTLFCAPLQCTVGLPKEIKRIIIIASDIRDNTDIAGAMHFTTTLQNTANFPQTYPNIELTLTNLNDEALLTRILKPKDYLAKGTDINAGFLAQEVINIDLNILAEAVVVSGYRVLIRY